MCVANLGIGFGCSPYVDRGETLYREGRYVEAAEVFELTEQRLASSSPSVRAEYGLFRGMTFLRLDDLTSARRWLGYAGALEQNDPELFEGTKLALLERAWAELDQRSRAVPPNVGDPPRLATEEPASTGLVAGPAANGRRAVAPQ